MAKRNRTRRARNKIEGQPYEGSLIKVQSAPILDAPAVVYRSNLVAVSRSTLFTAEFEAIIEIIARDRVYRAMFARFARRLPAST